MSSDFFDFKGVVKTRLDNTSIPKSIYRLPLLCLERDCISAKSTCTSVINPAAIVLLLLKFTLFWRIRV
ncbi:unnamed protein product [Meloidogyne enterolobii]|uniref:Uncharacterized protein n=1 Tax=Meloidogyne enterolobii TaxID=390850 RepID=A0ACB0XX11_MELEN